MRRHSRWGGDPLPSQDGAPREASTELLDLTTRKLRQAGFVTAKASDYKYKLMILESPNCIHSWHAGTSFFWQCWNLFLFAANTWTICCDVVFMPQVFFPVLQPFANMMHTHNGSLHNLLQAYEYSLRSERSVGNLVQEKYCYQKMWGGEGRDAAMDGQANLTI
jgi:hypothetical protein